VLLALACGVLTLARFLVPAETADEGETLGLVVGWLALATVIPWMAWRDGRFSWRPSWPEAAVLGLALPQVVSAIALLVHGVGNRRAALNMLWEWLGVAVAFAVLRVWTRSTPGREQLRTLLIAAGLLLAGLGVWQRLVFYPQIQAAYLEWQALDAGRHGRGPQVTQRLAELQRELGPELLALAGSSAAALKQRILDSHEPFGRFGLTNTLGGVLSVTLILLAGLLPPRDRWGWTLWSVAAAVTGCTLALTRSRTAWLATLCGLVVLAVVRWTDGAERSVRRWMWRRFVLGALGVIPLASLALALGAVDRQDLVEAPKSVLYRIQYWTATWPIIREHPWLGVGPGNFRQHYLQHKLPEASEEISDPHNLVLDLWSTGGVPGLLGLLGILTLAVWRWRAILAQPPETSSVVRVDVPGEHWRWLCVVGWLTCGLIFAAGFAFANRIDREVLWLGLAWGPAAWTADRLNGTCRHPASTSVAAPAAGLAILIHLATSGGIAMPVVTLLLLMLLFVLSQDPVAADAPVADANAPRSRLSLPIHFTGGRTAGLFATSGALLLAGCLWSGWGPVTMAEMQLSAAETVLRVDHRPQEAVDLYRLATESDPWNPRTWEGLMLGEATLWQRGGRDAERRFEAALAASERMRAADALDPHADRLQGELWMRRFQSTRRAADAAAAVVAFSRAAELYPHSALIQMLLARACQAAGEPTRASGAARRALQLDDLFIVAGHYDKVLPPADRQELEVLAGN
jgi:tetratricopeptide (TPR) repeat protein